MQEELKNTKLIIIDEYSVVGRKMVSNVDLRCRDVFSNNEPFGNVRVMLIGDIRQLPPVFDTLLYAEGGNGMQVTGSLSWEKHSLDQLEE